MGTGLEDFAESFGEVGGVGGQADVPAGEVLESGAEVLGQVVGQLAE
ncbi:hypothetical protein L3Q67_33905 [Saccharothrix sp. AJ9571]|nr:hypothetical protein L3Q67_33905 [Saccharothrix sp. AJ9571]